MSPVSCASSAQNFSQLLHRQRAIQSNTAKNPRSHNMIVQANHSPKLLVSGSQAVGSTEAVKGFPGGRYRVSLCALLRSQLTKHTRTTARSPDRNRPKRCCRCVYGSAVRVFGGIGTVLRAQPRLALINGERSRETRRRKPGDLIDPPAVARQADFCRQFDLRGL